MKDNFTHINYDLLVKFLLKETSQQENRQVQEWLDASKANIQTLEELQIIWEQSSEGKLPQRVDVNDAWRKFQKRINQQEVPDGKVVPMVKVRHWPLMKIAAALIIVATGLWLYYFIETKPVKTLAVTSRAASLTDTLPDGSVITLNKYSSISYPETFKGATRNVDLTGEAFFRISPNKKKPFIIRVNNLAVKVVGTSFNIRSTGTNTEVIVETGIVEVTGNNQAVRLKQGEKLLVNKTGLRMEKEPVTDILYNYYRTKVFTCDVTPLWKLVDVLNQAYDANIVIGRKELRSLPISTTFDNQPLDSILVIISETFKLSVVRSGDTIVLQ